MRLGDIAEALGGALIGDAAIEIDRLASLERAGPRCLAVLSNPRYKAAAMRTGAAALVADQGFAADHADQAPCPVIAVENPLLSLVKALELLWSPPARDEGVSERAHVHPDAQLGEGVSVMPFAYVGRARVGANTRVFPHSFIDDDVEIGASCEIRPGCVLMHGTRLGDRVILQPGVTLGGDGFGFASDGPRHVKIPQIGGIEVGDDVEIGSLCAIDRGALDQTTLGRGSKLDNLVQVGHNVQVGEDVILVAQVGIAGSTTIGDGAVLAGKVGVGDHVKIGAGARIGAFSAVATDIPERGAYSGIPAFPHGAWLRSVTHNKSFDKLVRRLRETERRLDLIVADTHRQGE